MKSRARFFIAVSVTLVVAWCAAWHERQAGTTFTGGTRILAANTEARWYRGNLHTHTLWSDGDDYPEMVAIWYRDHQYDFLCYTDHNILQRAEKWTEVEKNKFTQLAYDRLRTRFPDNWIEERVRPDGGHEVKLKTFSQVSERLSEPQKFLLIQGEEITDKFAKKPVHMNASNLRDPIPPHGGSSVYEVMQNNTNAVIAQRERTGQPILVHLNHPNFGGGITAEDLARVRGENFFEVYNGHPGVHNKGDNLHASTERIWDIILTKRLAELDLPLMYGLATDDGHSYHKIPSRASEPGRGWVMVLARELTPAALIESLEQGQFYASSGVSLSRVIADERGLTVDVAAEPDVEYTIEFVGTRKGYEASSSPVLDKDGKEIDTTRRYSDDIGRVLAKTTGVTATYQFTGDELYVRARVTSSKLHPNPSAVGDFEQAWVQPTRGPVAVKP